MISFQLDENLNSKKLARRCNSVFPGRVCRYPSHLMGAADPEMLQHVLMGEKPLVTLDTSLHYDHIDWIPETHPGIVIIFDDSTPSAMTAKRAEDVIEVFKTQVRNLDVVPWRNHIFEICKNSFKVFVVKKRRLICVDAAKFCDHSAVRISLLNKDQA